MALFELLADERDRVAKSAPRRELQRAELHMALAAGHATVLELRGQLDRISVASKPAVR